MINCRSLLNIEDSVLVPCCKSDIAVCSRINTLRSSDNDKYFFLVAVVYVLLLAENFNIYMLL